jgi:hypothetical protein
MTGHRTGGEPMPPVDVLDEVHGSRKQLIEVIVGIELKLDLDRRLEQKDIRAVQVADLDQPHSGSPPLGQARIVNQV